MPPERPWPVSAPVKNTGPTNSAAGAPTAPRRPAPLSTPRGSSRAPAPPRTPTPTTTAPAPSPVKGRTTRCGSARDPRGSRGVGGGGGQQVGHHQHGRPLIVEPRRGLLFRDDADGIVDPLAILVTGIDRAAPLLF